MTYLIKRARNRLIRHYSYFWHFLTIRSIFLFSFFGLFIRQVFVLSWRRKWLWVVCWLGITVVVLEWISDAVVAISVHNRSYALWRMGDCLYHLDLVNFAELLIVILNLNTACASMGVFVLLIVLFYLFFEWLMDYPPLHKHFFVINEMIMWTFEDLYKFIVDFLVVLVFAFVWRWQLFEFILLDSLVLTFFEMILGLFKLISQGLYFDHKQEDQRQVFLGSILFGLIFGEQSLDI